MGAIDLHVHTTWSDGTLSPAQMVEEAARRGVRVLGIADHDTTDGVAPAMAAGRELDVTVVPGVEVNTDWQGEEIHVLGYCMDTQDAELCEELTRLRTSRDERNSQILCRLAALEVAVSEARVCELAGHGSVGRPHIAAAMVEAGWVGTTNEAFSRFLARGRPAYVERHTVTPMRAIRMIYRAGGISVLAHPATLRDQGTVGWLVAQGVGGLEAFYPDQTPEAAAYYVDMARRLGLVVTGGTDFHGPVRGLSAHPGIPSAEIGSVEVPDWVWDDLRTRMPKRP